MGFTSKANNNKISKHDQTSPRPNNTLNWTPTRGNLLEQGLTQAIKLWTRISKFGTWFFVLWTCVLLFGLVFEWFVLCFFVV